MVPWDPGHFSMLLLHSYQEFSSCRTCDQSRDPQMPSAIQPWVRPHTFPFGLSSCLQGLINGIAHSMDVPDTEPRSPGGHCRPLQSAFVPSAPNLYPPRGLRVSFKTVRARPCPGFSSSVDRHPPSHSLCFRQAPFSTLTTWAGALSPPTQKPHFTQSLAST